MCATKWLLCSAVLVVSVANCKKPADKLASTSAPGPKVHTTRGWAGGGTVWLRMQTESGKRFLLTEVEPGKGGTYALEREKSGEAMEPWSYPVYRYDPERDALEAVPRKSWDEATGVLLSFGEYSGSGGFPVFIDHLARGLRYKGAPVKTRGTYDLALAVHSATSRLAVLSADGPEKDEISFGFGKRRYRGQHYHEAFSLPDLEPLGEAVAIPLKHDKDWLSMSWSPDGRFVIYYESSFRRVCIIPVEQQEREKP